jgi:hypothetical protein
MIELRCSICERNDPGAVDRHNKKCKVCPNSPSLQRKCKSCSKWFKYNGGKNYHNFDICRRTQNNRNSFYPTPNRIEKKDLLQTRTYSTSSIDPTILTAGWTTSHDELTENVVEPSNDFSIGYESERINIDHVLSYHDNDNELGDTAYWRMKKNLNEVFEQGDLVEIDENQHITKICSKEGANLSVVSKNYKFFSDIFFKSEFDKNRQITKEDGEYVVHSGVTTINIEGPFQQGDYIVPSDKNNGKALAVKKPGSRILGVVGNIKDGKPFVTIPWHGFNTKKTKYPPTAIISMIILFNCVMIPCLVFSLFGILFATSYLVDPQLSELNEVHNALRLIKDGLAQRNWIKTIIENSNFKTNPIYQQVNKKFITVNSDGSTTICHYDFSNENMTISHPDYQNPAFRYRSLLYENQKQLCLALNDINNATFDPWVRSFLGYNQNSTILFKTVYNYTPKELREQDKEHLRTYLKFEEILMNTTHFKYLLDRSENFLKETANDYNDRIVEIFLIVLIVTLSCLFTVVFLIIVWNLISTITVIDRTK